MWQTDRLRVRRELAACRSGAVMHATGITTEHPGHSRSAAAGGGLRDAQRGVSARRARWSHSPEPLTARTGLHSMRTSCVHLQAGESAATQEEGPVGETKGGAPGGDVGGEACGGQGVLEVAAPRDGQRLPPQRLDQVLRVVPPPRLPCSHLSPRPERTTSTSSLFARLRVC